MDAYEFGGSVRECTYVRPAALRTPACPPTGLQMTRKIRHSLLLVRELIREAYSFGKALEFGELTMPKSSADIMAEWALAANSVAAVIDERCEKDADAIAATSDLIRAIPGMVRRLEQYARRSPPSAKGTDRHVERLLSMGQSINA